MLNADKENMLLKTKKEQCIFIISLTVVVYSDCYPKNTMDWVACKQYKFISHSSGGWGIQNQDSGGFSLLLGL